jgi:polyisoprenoid-binding protein YceI
MPVSIVRRYAVRAFVAATVLATLAAVASFVVVAASPSLMAPSFMAQTAAPDGVETARIANSLDVMRVDLVPGGSEARYRAQEVLASRGNNEAVGRTPDVSGSILLYSDGTVLSEQSRITVDMRTLQSDSTMRDNYIKRSTLQVDEHPMADFVVTSTPGLPAPLPKSGTASFELVGDLTVHGVTRPTTWQATATFAESEVTGSATTTVLITDFGMTPPKVGSVLSIEDAVQLELDVGGTVAPSLADLLSDVE